MQVSWKKLFWKNFIAFRSHITQVRKLMLVRKFKKKSVIFVVGRLVDSVDSFEFK